MEHGISISKKKKKCNKNRQNVGAVYRIKCINLDKNIPCSDNEYKRKGKVG